MIDSLFRLKGFSSLRRGLSLIETAVVILVVAILMGLSLSLVRHFALLSTTKSEAKKLADSLVFIRNAAIKSNTIIYFEFDLDEESYRAYRVEGSEEDLKEKILLKPVELSSSHSLIAISSATGSRNTEGKIKLSFLPSGLAEEVAIYMGPREERDTQATIIYNRYQGKASVHKGEKEHRLEDPTWEELDLID